VIAQALFERPADENSGGVAPPAATCHTLGLTANAKDATESKPEPVQISAKTKENKPSMCGG
jgi:hypothetical protein